MTRRKREGMSPIDDTRRSGGTITPPSERSFGWVFTTVFAIIGGYQCYAGREEVGASFLAVAAVIAITAWFKPSILARPNLWWFRFGLLLNKLVTPVVMFFVFVTTFVPIGLIMRAMGYDPLRRKKQPAASTYWIERSPPGPDPDSMRNPF